jgi:hypothetical protein
MRNGAETTVAETVAAGGRARSPTVHIAPSGFELPLLGSTRKRSEREPEGVNEDRRAYSPPVEVAPPGLEPGLS